jgi:hypothetical protein
LSQGTDPVLDNIPFCIRSFVAKDLALVYDIFHVQKKKTPRHPKHNKIYPKVGK